MLLGSIFMILATNSGVRVGFLVAAAAAPGEPQNPAFVANPGQGQGSPTDPSAAEAAEYERFYPSTPNGK